MPKALLTGKYSSSKSEISYMYKRKPDPVKDPA